MVGFGFPLVAIAALLPQALAQTCATITPANPATFASGYSGKVLLNGLRGPRALIFDNQGNILTVERSSYGVRYIKITDNGGSNVCVQSNKQLIADSSFNHGIALTPDGKKLFVSSLTSVFSFDYDGVAGTVSNRKTVITGMQNDGHSTRTLLVPKSSPGTLMVQRGSSVNIDTEAAQIGTARSQIRTFSIAALETASVAYNTGTVLAWGLRNTVAFGEDPAGGIWSVDNGMDNMARNGVDVHNTNPCEELNYHGIVSNTSDPLRGAHYGYPECAAVWDPSVLPSPLNTQLNTGSVLVHTSESGANTDARCRSERQSPRLCFPPHTAPLDIKFNQNGTAGYIAFHGSWNRSPPDGYRVARVEFNPATGQPVQPSTSRDAAFNIMFNANNSACPNRCFRPTGLVWRAGGRLFLTSDSTNELWLINGAT